MILSKQPTKYVERRCCSVKEAQVSISHYCKLEVDVTPFGQNFYLENFVKQLMFENIIIELNNLKDDQYLSFNKIEYWLLKYNTLYSQTKYNYDCSEYKFPCMCWNRKKDCLFIDVFDALEIISKMYYKNLFYTNELIRYEKIKQDQIEVKRWLFENLEENDIDLPYSSTNEIYYDKVISLRNGKNVEEYNTYILKFKGEDFKSSYDFFYLYNELFFTQKILPKEYEIWKMDSGYIDFEE